MNTKLGDWSSTNEEIKNTRQFSGKIEVKLEMVEHAYKYYVNGDLLTVYNARSNNEIANAFHFFVISTVNIDSVRMPDELKQIVSSAAEEVTNYENYNYLLKDHAYDLIIGVLSSPSNFVHRWSIRKSWLMYPQVKDGKYFALVFDLK